MTPATIKIALFEDQHAQDLLLKYLLLGGVAGGTLAGGQALIKHMQNINTRAENNPKQDEVMSAKLAEIKAAGGRGNITGMELALAVLGGGGAGYLGYKGIQNIDQWLTRKKLERELDQVQNAYMADLSDLSKDPAMAKVAQDTSGVADFGAGAYIMMALAMAAGGIGSYQALNKAFPKTDPQRKTREFKPIATGVTLTEDDTDTPRKAEYDNLSQDALDEDDRSIPSYSTDTSERVIFASADTQSEYLLNLILGDERQAKQSGFLDLVNSVAVGRGEELWKKADSVDDLFAKAKDMNDKIEDEPTPERRQIAVTVISMHPGMSAALSPLLGAEVNDMSPMMTMMGGGCSCGGQNVLNSLMGTLVGGQRKRILIKLSSKLGSLGIDFTKKASEGYIVDYATDTAVLAHNLNRLLQTDLI